MAHLSRLDHELRQLLHAQRVASLGTLDRDGEPQVSMVPYAIETHASTLILHVSALAAHTGNMARHPAVSVLVMQSPGTDAPVHALPRVTLQARAEPPEPDSASWRAARAAYLARFPEAAPMMALADFRLVVLQLVRARHVAGFGAARTVEAGLLAQLLAQGDDLDGGANGDPMRPR